jgi:hypothetical protein
MADPAVERYVKHARLFGHDGIFEAAAEDGLAPIELARLVEQLRRLPRQRPGNEYRRESDGRWYHGPAFKLSQAQRERLIRRMLAAGYDADFTARLTEATVAYVRRLDRGRA